MGWKQEFGPDLEVPGLIDYMVSLGTLEDISWHNDSGAAFLLKDASDEDVQFRFVVDHPLLSFREVDENKRFLVVESTPDDDHAWTLSTDDLEEAVTALLTRANNRLPRDKRPHFEKMAKAWRQTVAG